MDYTAIVDKIDDSIVTLETLTGEIIIIPKSKIPFSVIEGDCLNFRNGNFYKDSKKRSELEKINKDLMNGLIK